MTDKHGRYLFAANYGDGSLASFRVNSDGSLSEAVDVKRHSGSSANKERQEGPHCHCSVVDLESNQYLFVADLGLDKVVVYKIDSASGKLEKGDPDIQVSVPPGAGPRHFVFHPTNKFGYVVNELHCNVCVYAYDSSTGKLTFKQKISTLPENYGTTNTTTNTCAAIKITPDGSTLYASNRGHDTLAVFTVDIKTGLLKAIAHISTKGKTPRDFAIHPSGSYLVVANQDSSSLVTFKIEKDGKLSDTGKRVDSASPVCVVFLGSGLTSKY